jgi:hypothetical protein
MNMVSAGLVSSLSTLRTALVDAGYNVPVAWGAGNIAPINGAFTPNPASDPFDQLLEALADAIDDPASAYADYDALLTAFVAGSNLPDAPPPAAPETQPATVNASLVKSYSLTFTDSDCGPACPFVNGQNYTAVVGSDNSLTINSEKLMSPVNQKYAGEFYFTEIIWADGNLRYALSNNQTGAFNEINLGDANQPRPDGLPKYLGQFKVAAVVPTGSAIEAVQALAGSYNFNAGPNGSSGADIAGTAPRGLKLYSNYPDCNAIGLTGGDNPWTARVVVGSNGSVSIQNPDNAAKAFTLTPGTVDANDKTEVTIYNSPTMWAMKNPGSTVYQIKRTVRYDDGVHPQLLTDSFTAQLGVKSTGELADIRLMGQTSPRMEFCAVGSMTKPVADELASLKALAGNYTLRQDYLVGAPNYVAPAWTTVDIGTNGSVTFGGVGPSFSPSEIAKVVTNFRNDSNYSSDGSVLGLSVILNKDINGDGTVNVLDRVNFLLTEDEALRDIHYKDSSTHLVEVSVRNPVLPAYDDTLAAGLSGDGISARISGTALSINSTETYTKIEVANSATVGFFVGRNDYQYVPEGEQRAWRIMVSNSSPQINTPYSCAAAGGSVNFDDGIGVLTGVGSGGNVPPANTSGAGGSCEITLTSVTKVVGKVTGVEGKFRATLWQGDEKLHVPAVGFFRLTSPPAP